MDIPGLEGIGARFFGLEERTETAPRAKPDKAAEKAKAEARARELAAAYKACFSTRAGRMVLAHLEERTTHLSTFDARLGLLEGIANGFAREGQNSMVHFIKSMIARGQEL